MQYLNNYNAVTAAKLDRIGVLWFSRLVQSAFVYPKNLSEPQARVPQYVDGSLEALEPDFCGWVVLEKSARDDLIDSGEHELERFDSFGQLPGAHALRRRKGNGMRLDGKMPQSGLSPVAVTSIAEFASNIVAGGSAWTANLENRPLHDPVIVNHENTYVSRAVVRSIADAQGWPVTGPLLVQSVEDVGANNSDSSRVPPDIGESREARLLILLAAAAKLVADHERKHARRPTLSKLNKNPNWSSLAMAIKLECGGLEGCNEGSIANDLGRGWKLLTTKK